MVGARRRRRIVADWETSGESVAGFASRLGIDSQRLYWWRRRLRASASETAAGSARLVPVTLREIADGNVGAAIVVSVAGIRIDVHEVDAATAAWVRALIGSRAGEQP
jgi:hypothetical protein